MTPSQDKPNGEPTSVNSSTDGTANSPGTTTPLPTIGTPETDQDNVHVSDLDSDIELDELVPTYLKIKSKLYEIDPELVEPRTRKQTKGKRAQKSTSSTPTMHPSTKKLLSQLQKIASDALFDEREADVLWPTRRNQIAQEKAAGRPRQSSISRAEVIEKSSPTSAQQATVKETIDPVTSEDEVDLLGDMFTAVPDDTIAAPSITGAESTNVTLRDFGKATGLTPRKVLEEAMRSR